MAISDHKFSGGTCAFDHAVWPCRTVRILREAAGLIRNTPASPNETDGMYAAADLLESLGDPNGR